MTCQLLCREAGNGFDLEQELFLGKALYFDKSACGRSRNIHILVTYLAKNGQVRPIKYVHIQLHHMAEVRSSRRQRGPDVKKDLLSLSPEIAGSDQVSRSIESNLAGDIDCLPPSDFDDLRVSRRCGEGRRGEKLQMIRRGHSGLLPFIIAEWL
jgi:hypothetical protein